MVIDLMVERVWRIARPIVLSWTDEASEIFIIDLPLHELQRILELLATCLFNPRLLRIDGINLGRSRPLDELQRQRVVQLSRHSTVHCLRGELEEGGGSCYFYFWVHAEQQQVEVEMVFWNDACFPAGRSLEQHKQLLGHLMRIAEQVRGDNHQCKCILSREYNAEPRELLGSAKVAIW